MEQRIVFFNTGWMDFYRGLSNDKIVGGGKNVNSMGWGGELFNFLPFDTYLYGYVQPKIDKKYDNPTTIKIEKLGAKESDERIDEVTVVWTATDPDNGGTYIIGWYKKATVFRYYQDPPKDSKRTHKRNSLGYFVKAKAKNNATLLSLDERVVQVQRQQKNWMGQSNVWYAEKNPSFVKIVKDYIFKGIIPKQVRYLNNTKGSSRRTDVLKRIEVEKKAVLIVMKHYENLGYKITSVEKDNVGWDLIAKNNKTELKLEVKGLSGTNLAAELTPNELKNLKDDKVFYRLCIVTNTLVKPVLKIFAHSKQYNEWMSEDGAILKFQEVVSAKIYL